MDETNSTKYSIMSITHNSKAIKPVLESYRKMTFEKKPEIEKMLADEAKKKDEETKVSEAKEEEKPEKSDLKQQPAKQQKTSQKK